MSIELSIIIISVLIVVIVLGSIRLIGLKKRSGFESLMYDIYNNIECGIIILNRKNNLVKINHRITGIFGLSYSELENKKITHLLDTNTNANFFEKLNTALKQENLNNGVVHTFREEIVTKFGIKVNIECRIVPHLYKSKLKNTIIVFKDITEISELQQQISYLSDKINQNEEKHPLVNFIAVISKKMEISLLSIGHRIISLVGKSADDILQNPKLLFPDNDDDTKEFREVLAYSCQNLIPIDYKGKFKHSDGSLKFLNIHALPYHEDNKLFLKGFINDITESHTQNQIIKEQRQFLSSIIESSPIGIFAKDYPEGKYQVINGKAIEYFGLTQADLIGSTDSSIFNESDLFYNNLADLESDCIKSLNTETGKTFEYQTDLGLKQIYLQMVPVVLDHKLILTVGIIHDLTENVNIINTYKERQNQLTAIVENNMVGVVVVDKQLRIQYANKAISKMTGFSINELQNMTSDAISDLVSLSIDPSSFEKVWTGEQASLHAEQQYTRKDGTSFFTEVFVSPVLDNQDRITSTVALVLNIDKRKEAERMLMQRDKILEAVSFASRHFLNEDNFEKETDRIFSAISESTQADYVGIYRLHRSKDEAIGTLYNALHSENSKKQKYQAINEINFFDSNKEIIAQLDLGKYIYLTESKQSPMNTFLIENNEKSVFISPIIVDTDLWGFVKIGKIHDEQFWSHAELDALQSASNVLGAALNRRNINSQLKELNAELESRIKQRTVLLEDEIKERALVEDSLRVSQKKLKKMIDIAPIGIARITDQYIIQEANPKFQSIFEYESHELEGKSFIQLYPEKQRAIYERLHKMFLENGTDSTGERPFISKNDKQITAYINLLSTNNEKDKIETYVFIYDITEQRRVETNAKKLKLGIEKSFDAFVITDLFGSVEYVNEAFERITGYQSEEILGKNIRILKSGLQTPEFYKHMWDEILSGMSWQGTLINKKKNGDFYYEEMTIVPVFNDLNITTNFVAIKRDITSVKKNQEETIKSETKYRQIFENATEGIIMLNYENILFANPAFEYLTGYTNFQVSNRKFIDMIFDADKETVFKLTHSKDKAFLHKRHDVRLIDSNNNIKWVNINANKVNWDNKIMVLLFISNITARKKAEEALEEERSYLADRVIERTEELSALNAELSKAVRAKDEFLANMSHELRTPLNAILGLSEILQYQLQTSISEKQIKSFKTIHESGQHLLSLINDILDLSKIEAGKLDIIQENVAIDPIAVSSLRFVTEAAKKKDIKIDYTPVTSSLMVWADTRRLRQILINLLSNAVKFTPHGKEIGLRITAPEDLESVFFEVWDRGIGISERDMKSLFKPFVQLDSALSREYEGSGLGLALVSKLVELHGGSIEVKSTVGEGSSFKVALPAKNPDLIELDEESDYDISFMKDRTIIIITENHRDFDIIAGLTSPWTKHIYLFEDDSRNINDVMEILPDLIILDTAVKHRSAWEILSILKNDKRTKGIKIILASVGQELEKASVVGADAFIGKPINVNKVQKALCQTYGISEVLANSNIEVKKQTILLAEDNEANIETIEAFLTTHKYKIIVARNGQEAIEWVHEHRPDLILMDIQMPKMNGFEAIEFLKTSDEFKDIPIIALTALAMPGDRKRILEAGANDYLSKPISMKILINRIETFLKSSL